MNVIETQELRRTFGSKDAVRSLDLRVPAGSVCALLGPNGAGKTTTIKMLMNLIRPSGGQARVLGVDSRRLGAVEKARIGYVSENHEMPEWMTVRAFLDYCREFYPTWDRELEAKLLTRFALPEERSLKHLSRGMKMKAALLAALAYRPELLVLDEPFSGLDPAVREDFVRGLFEATGDGEWSILVSSHDIDEVERFVDWIAFIDDGRLVISESLESLQARFRRVEVTLADQMMIRAEELPPAWRDLQQSGKLVRFIDTAHMEADGGRLYAERFPGAAMTAGQLSVRDIYMTVARMTRV